MKSVARRASDGRMPRLVKAWPGCRRKRTTGSSARTAPIERAGLFLSGQPCMRRFILGRKLPGHAWRLSSGIVNYADDFHLFGKAPAAEMLPAVRRIMERPKLQLNEEKAGCLRCPEEAQEILGQRVGSNYRTREPKSAPAWSICHKVSERTTAKHWWMTSEDMVGHPTGCCLAGRTTVTSDWSAWPTRP